MVRLRRLWEDMLVYPEQPSNFAASLLPIHTRAWLVRTILIYFTTGVLTASAAAVSMYLAPNWWSNPTTVPTNTLVPTLYIDKIRDELKHRSNIPTSPDTSGLMSMNIPDMVAISSEESVFFSVSAESVRERQEIWATKFYTAALGQFEVASRMSLEGVYAFSSAGEKIGFYQFDLDTRADSTRSGIFTRAFRYLIYSRNNPDSTCRLLVPTINISIERDNHITFAHLNDDNSLLLYFAGHGNNLDERRGEWKLGNATDVLTDDLHSSCFNIRIRSLQKD